METQAGVQSQISTITDFYHGPTDDLGRKCIPETFGSEPRWVNYYIPYKGNNKSSKLVGVAGDHMNYLFYENDPGKTIPNIRDYEYEAKTTGPYSGKRILTIFIQGDLMKSIRCYDPDLRSFLRDHDGRLIIYHGWADTLIVGEDTVDKMVNATFGGDLKTASEKARLFMAPGMGHCGGGPGPNTWDKLDPMVDWVENGIAPDHVVAEHFTDGVVDNQRPICTYQNKQSTLVLLS